MLFASREVNSSIVTFSKILSISIAAQPVSQSPLLMAHRFVTYCEKLSYLPASKFFHLPKRS
jgi:hypothetical protein